MALTQDAILSVLLEEGGKMKNSDLLMKFKAPLNCSDVSEKKQNRELFKTIINSLAVVKEIEEVKHVVLRKKFQHLLKNRSEDENEQKDEGGGVEQEKEEQKDEGGGVEQEKEEQKDEGGGVEQEKEEQKELREVCEDEEANEAPPEEKKPKQKAPSHTEAASSDASPEPSFMEQALQRHTSTVFRPKKSLHFVMPLKPDTHDSQKHTPACSNTAGVSTPKRFALPLRMPPVVVTPVAHIEMNKMKIPSNGSNPDKVHLAPVSATPGPPCSPRYKRRSSVDSVGISSSPQPRRHCKSVKPADEPKYADIVPLEGSEHKWMVMSASGHWTSLYGLLLDDAQLAEKRDFISGFTALHWAAKCGNSDMLCKIIDLSRKNGKGVDINTKSYAGYTPLHIAAIHGQGYTIGILVNEYGANCNIRDNSGKKAHHYLDQGASHSIRELLGGLKEVHAEPQKNTEDTDTHKHTHTISRLFQQQTIGYKKKPKSRNTLWSMAEDAKDEKGEHSNPMHRVLSDVFS